MPNQFQNRVYNLLKKIPKGKVATYKVLAHKLNTKAYRAVGQALKCNPFSPEVPCHRVVCADGSVGGYIGNQNPKSKEVRKKINMLIKEGVKIKNNKVADFDNVLFGF